MTYWFTSSPVVTVEQCSEVHPNSTVTVHCSDSLRQVKFGANSECSLLRDSERSEPLWDHLEADNRF